MTPPDLNLDARLSQFLTRENKLAFALIRPDLTLSDHSDNLPHFIEPPTELIPAMALTDLFWEFVGSEEILQSILRGQQRRYILENVWREGENGRTYLTFECIPTNPDQPQEGLLLIIRDSTARGILEQQLVQERNELRLTRTKLSVANSELQRLNQLKSLFLSMAAHDLRTPLTVILGFAKILLTEVPSNFSDSQVESLEAISSQAKWLDQLISDVLALNQIEEGRLVLNSAEQDINNVAKEIEELMQNTARSKNQTLTLVPSNTPVYAYFDEERLRQVMFNLIGNALKYTPTNGRVTITINESDNAAGFSIHDNGRGLSPADQAMLFQPYYRTDEAAQSTIKGTGLGLHIVNMLIDAHHGHVDVESTLGEGTTFTVWLPKSKHDFMES